MSKFVEAVKLMAYDNGIPMEDVNRIVELAYKIFNEDELNEAAENASKVLRKDEFGDDTNDLEILVLGEESEQLEICVYYPTLCEALDYVFENV